MRKIIILFVLGLTANTLKSQDISDALRYAVPNLNGTARYNAMSGAFGALGGDLSALNSNPAGAAIFNNSQFTITLNNRNLTNKSNYFGSTASRSDSSFDLNQAGGVFVFENQNLKSDWKKISVGINYENTNNFDNSLYSAGTNPTHSVDSYFLYFANTDGGTLVLGLADLKEFKGDARLFGIEENPEAVDELQRKLLTEFLPAIETIRLRRLPYKLHNGPAKGQTDGQGLRQGPRRRRRVRQERTGHR